jgi:hypothetical protein
MKFLTKNPNSEILVEGLVYTASRNTRLRTKLLDEQKNFCAYTEKFITKIDSVEVEHFNPSIKYKDDYYNYYTTLRYANERKIGMEKKFDGFEFFKNRFFQSKEEFSKRITYRDFDYVPVNENDIDAKGLIDFLGFNDDYLYSERIKHIQRLKFSLGTFTKDEILLYFRKFREQLSYVTAIEDAFEIDLSEIINNL